MNTSISFCPHTGLKCAIQPCPAQGMCKANILEATQTPVMYGWECPRCHKIHSPFVRDCDCLPPYQTAATISLTEVLNHQPDKQ